jgi:hypothetical protein
VNGPIKVEPSAEQRTAAKTIRAFYIALLDEGFTEAQSLVIVGQMMSAAANGGTP